MTPEPSSSEPKSPPPSPLLPSNLKRIQFKGSVVAYACVGVLVGLLGLFGVTGLSSTPWLFLLYPLLIGLLLVSLSALVLHLLHRF